MGLLSQIENVKSMRGARTSLESPLRIDTITVGDTQAQIGMTICPGKRGDSQYGVAWDRDLDADLTAIRDWGATALVTIMELDEMRVLGVANLGVAADNASLQWYQLPITDGAVPDMRFDKAWLRVASAVLQHIRSGRKVVAYCRGGLGRTGMVVCFLLVELGESPKHALKIVRMARPGTVETYEQVDFVLNYTRRIS